MKKIIFILFLSSFLYSQTDSTKKSPWKKEGFFGVNASQTSLHNWQGGGQDNVALNAILNYQISYQRGKSAWINKLDAQYGIFKPGDFKKFRKNIDQLFFLSKFSLDAWNKYWFYSAQFDYRTQFAPGYIYVGDSIADRANSDFNSPGYIQIAPGLDYKPAPYFSAFLAPLAGKITMVNRQYLADAGAFGVEKAEFDANGMMKRPGKNTRYELGGRFVLKFKKDIMSNINLDSYLDLFSNYLKNPQNIDVVFNNLITFKINKFFTATLISQLIYDDDIVIKHDWNKDGDFNHPNDINGPRIQLHTTFGLGFGYKF
jgi:2-hydroxy-3-keto-5-methylthiopentenyl-1-phosphate phosphatase